MFSRFISFFRTSFSYIWLIALAIYFAVLSGQSVLRSYQANQDTENLQNQLTQVEQEKARLQALVVYYQTDDYKEKELRQEFLLKKPNEIVYALPESSSVQLDSSNVTIASAQAPATPKEDVPYWRQWLDYILYGKRSA